MLSSPAMSKPALRPTSIPRSLRGLVSVPLFGGFWVNSESLAASTTCSVVAVGCVKLNDEFS